MRVHLAIALALHAAVLGTGARWPRAKPAPGPPGAVEAIAVDVVPGPDKVRDAPPPPDPPRAPSGAGDRSAAHGSRARPAPRPVPPALLQAVRSEIHAPEGRAGDPSGGSDESRSAFAGEGGDGDGSPGTAAAPRPKRRGLGERWDAVGGPRSEEAPAHTDEAGESTLPRRAIDGVVAGSAPRLRRCYEVGLSRDPGLAGRIPVRFVVDPGGSVLVASDGGSTVADPSVVRCVLQAFAAMTFPPPRRGEAVRATFVVALPPD